MKRRYANSVSGIYLQDRIISDYITGDICFIKLKDIESPLVVSNEIHKVCIKDNDYEWYLVYPDNGKYAITIVYDDKDELVEWYFDVSKKVGLENGIPYEDDLYLDLVIAPDGEYAILDEDELNNALRCGDITEEDKKEAYETLDFLINKFVNNLDELINFTEVVKKKFK